MPGAVWGPLAAVVGVACLVAAYRASRSGRPRLALWWIVCAGLTLRVYMGSDRFLHPWDERYHALVAKHLIAHPLVPTLYDAPALPYDYRAWSDNRVWLHKPPLALWVAAGSMALFGVGEIAFRLPSLVISTLAIVLTYQIGLWLFGVRTALIAALFHAGNGLLIGFSAGIITSDHVDNLFVVLIELGVLVAVVWSRRRERRLALLLGVIVGLAVMTKLWTALLVIPILVCLGYRRRPPVALAVDLGLMMIAIAAIVAPWQVYIHRAFPQEAAWEASEVSRHLFESVEGQPTGLSYYLLRVPSIFGELLYLPLAWFLIRVVAARRSQDEWALALWIVLPAAGFSLAVSKSVSYLAVAGPALFLVQAEFLNRVAAWRAPSRWKDAARWVSFALLLALPLRFAVQRLNPFHPRDRDSAWAAALRSLDGTLSESVVLFGTEHPIEAMFVTRCTAYSFLPTPEQVRIVQSQGRTVAVCDDQTLPPDLATDVGIAKVRCR